MRLWLLLLGGCLACSAQAAVYRCEQDGRVVYRDQPCRPGDAPHDLPPLGTLPAVAADAGLAEAYDERLTRERERNAKDHAERLKTHEARKARDARMQAAIRQDQVLKDMTADEVRRAWGGPDEVERAPGRETWIYGSGKARRVVVFESGRVLRVQAPRSSR